MASNQGQPQDNKSLDVLWGTAFLVAVALVIWFFARGPLLQFFFTLKLAELWFFGLFTDQFDSVRAVILRYYSDPTVLSFAEVQTIFVAAGRPMRIPVAVILAGLALWIFLKHPMLKFKKVYTMTSLRDSEKNNWPQIIPVSRLNLIEEDISKGPWAMAQNPMEFAKKYQLLEELPKPLDPLLAKRGLIEVKVIEERARSIFSKQMGPVFESINDLPIHTKALFAVFAARASNDAEGAHALLMHIAASAATGKPDFSGVMPLLKKHYNTKPISRILSNHAYVYTVMASLLELARTTGVLATADFIWLKPIDRPLWYMLNCTGRHTAFCEIAGPFSHWKAELAMKRRIVRPMVDQAIRGLEEAVKMIIYTRDDDNG